MTGRESIAVIFDYDGVLVSSMPTHVAGSRRFVAARRSTSPL